MLTYIHNIYIHTNTYIMYTYMNTYIINTRRHAYTHLLYIYLYKHTYIHQYIHQYIHTYIHTYIHAYIHTNTHTHAHTQLSKRRGYSLLWISFIPKADHSVWLVVYKVALVQFPIFRPVFLCQLSLSTDAKYSHSFIDHRGYFGGAQIFPKSRSQL